MREGTKPSRSQPTDAPNKEGTKQHSSGPPVVGIGTSAGGLEMLKRFFNKMPVDTGLAFVLVQHLDPNHESMMVDLLSRYTKMPVSQVEDGLKVSANRVYVIPPGTSMTMRKGALRLEEPVERRGMRMPIDHFFRSLAEDRGPRAISIVLTGTGSDGTLGLREIKAQAGLTIVQDPKEAPYDGMPESAIATGLVDHILSVEAMPDILVNYVQHDYVQSDAAATLLKDGQEDTLHLILNAVAQASGRDFRDYKESTLIRRIHRRMGLNNITDLTEYYEYLRRDRREAVQLSKDLLISVTSFFRDRTLWEKLKEKVLAPLFDKPNLEMIRVWVAGCATGEEAYSVAMVLHELREERKKQVDFVVYATDIDKEAIEVARAGRYPWNIEADVSSERLERFFVKEEHSYLVKKNIRDRVVFAPQNLLRDAPFSRLDLVVCRNVLIYMEASLQKKIIRLFHFALKNSGYMFLGNSESINRQEDLFEPILKKERIYQRSAKAARFGIEFPTATSAGRYYEGDGHARDRDRERAPDLFELARNFVLKRYAPASVLINENQNALVFLGATEVYLRQPEGERTDHLVELAAEPLRVKLRHAVRKAVSNSEATVVSGAKLPLGERTLDVTITVNPLTTEASDERLFLVSFEEILPAQPASEVTEVPDAEKEEFIRSLEEDLKSTREELQSVIEELETSNEELKASNEEVMSMNEELQAANEELETSKEELQSLNEELTTLNGQLQEKVVECELTADDLNNFLNSSNVPTVFLDTNLCLRRFTPATRDLLNVIQSDIGRPFGDLSTKFRDDSLLDDARAVLQDLRVIEREVRSEEARWYLRRVQPYRTEDNRIEGIVATYSEVTELKTAQEQNEQLASELDERVNDLETVLRTVPVAIAVAYDAEANDIRLNPAGERLLRVPEGANASLSSVDAEALQFRVFRDGEELDPEDLPIQRAARTGMEVRGEEVEHVFQDGSRFFALVDATPLRDSHGEIRGAVASLLDITRRKKAEDDLKRVNESLERRVSERTAMAERQMVQLRALAAQLTDAEQRERRRLARVLHDHIQQLLVSARMDVTALSRKVEGEFESDKLHHLHELLSEVLEASKNLALDLSPPVLQDGDLGTAIRWLGRRMEEHYGLQVLVEDRVTTSTTAYADRVLAFDVTRELLMNVVKHGGVQTAEVSIDEIEPRKLALSVRDRGKGFDVSEVLDARERADSFGIWHVRERVTSVGGELQIDSRPGDGTAARVLIPLMAEPEVLSTDRLDSGETGEEWETGSGGPDGSSTEDDTLRVLIVDDHKIVRQGLRELLDYHDGIKVVGEAGDGADAIELVKALKPDIVLMDVNMPVMGGIEATQRIRTEWSDICIIGLSLHDDPEMIENMKSAGANDYVVKTCSEEELVRKVRQACELRAPEVS